MKLKIKIFKNNKKLKIFILIGNIKKLEYRVSSNFDKTTWSKII